MSSASLPPTPSPGTTVQDFRGRLLNILLTLGIIVAIPVAGVNITASLRGGHSLLASLYTSAVLALLLLRLLGRYPHLYIGRAWGLLFLAYIAALAAYLTTGVAGDGRVWLFGALVLGAVLLPEPHNFINFILGLVFHFGLGYAVTRGILPPPPLEYLVRSESFSAWVRTGLAVVGIGATAVAAATIYRRNLENTLEESQTLNEILEKERLRLEEQSRALARRLEQIHTASEISRTINTILDPDRLLERVVNLVRDRFNLYYVGIFLVDERGEYAVLRAGTGEAGRKMLAEEHRLAIGGASMIGWCISNRRPRIAMDVGEEAVRFANPHLPLTRTELALPLISRGEVLGAMTVQSERPRAFDEDDLIVLQSIVDNVATALHNARLYQEIQAGLRTLAETHQRLFAETWGGQGQDTMEIALETGQPHPTEKKTFSLRVPINLYGQPLGEIVLESPHPWSDNDRAFAEQAAAQLALAIENLYLVESAQRSAQEHRLLNELTEQIGATLDLDAIIQTALRQFHTLLHVNEAEIQLIVPEAEE